MLGNSTQHCLYGNDPYVSVIMCVSDIMHVNNIMHVNDITQLNDIKYANDINVHYADFMYVNSTNYINDIMNISCHFTDPMQQSPQGRESAQR